MTRSNVISSICTKVVIASYIKKGRCEITCYQDLKKFKKGHLISYLNIYGELKRAGFLLHVKKDYFVYLGLDLKTKKKVRYQFVDKMYVGDVYQVKNDIISLFPTIKKPTKYPLIVDGIVINYFTSEFAKKMYEYTQKHQILIKWIEIFKE